MGGGGSGGGGTTQSVSNSYSSLSPWAAPYVTSMLGAAQNQVFQTAPSTTDASGNVVQGQITGMNPYNAFGTSNGQGGQYGMTANDMNAANAAVAPFGSLQNQSFQGAGNLQTPGQYGMATGAAGMGTMGALNAGQNLQNTLTSGNAMSQYMNPFIQNALNPALQLSNQQYGITGQQMAGQATGAGAFGGSRNALQQGLNQQNQMLANNQLIGNAYNTAYGNAQTQANNVANMGLQGNQAAITGANTLANIGASQNQTNLANLGVQNQYGQQQTAGQQAIINQAMQNYQTGQNYPMTQLTNLKNLASGIPMTDTTQNVQTAAPSTANLIGGAGMTGLGIAAMTGNSPTTTINIPQGQTNPLAAGATSTNAQGGIMKVKKMASGGIGAIVNKAINNPSSVPDQSLKDGVIPKGLPADLIGVLKTSEALQSKAPPPAPTSTVAQDNVAKLQQLDQQSVQKLLAQYPTIMADLQVKRDIAKEKGDKHELRIVDAQIAEVSALAQHAQAQMQQQPAQGPGPLAAPQPQQPQMAQAPQPQPDLSQQAPTQAAKAGGIMKVKKYAGNTDGSVATSGWSSDPNYDPNTQGFPTRMGDIGAYWNAKVSPALSDLKQQINTGKASSKLTTADTEDMESPDATIRGQDPTKQIAPPGSLNPVLAGSKPAAPAPAPVDRTSLLSAKPPTSAPPTPSLDLYDPTKQTNDITKMVNNWTGMMMNQYNKDTTMQDIGRGLIAGGASMSQGIGRNAGLAAGISGFGTGYLKSAESSEARKDKLLSQLIATGLSGQGLIMQAQHLGLTKEDLRQKGLLIPSTIAAKEAEAIYHKAGAAHMGDAKAAAILSAGVKNHADAVIKLMNQGANESEATDLADRLYNKQGAVQLNDAQQKLLNKYSKG